MTNEKRFQWLKQKEFYKDTFKLKPYWGFIFEKENAVFCICIPVNSKGELYFEPTHLSFDELPLWFREIYKVVENQVKERDAVRRLISEKS